MEWKTRAARSCVVGLLPMILILPGCSALRELQHDQMVGETAMAPSAQELPVEPMVQSPIIPEPEMPQVASRTPNSKGAPATKKITPPVKRAPVPVPKVTEPLVLAPADLVGFDFSSVLQVLRRPDTVQSSSVSIVWTYTEPNCTLQLFFYPDIQTKIFRLLKHDLKSAADGAAERSACMRDIMVVKNDEPASP